MKGKQVRASNYVSPVFHVSTLTIGCIGHSLVRLQHFSLICHSDDRAMKMYPVLNQEPHHEDIMGEWRMGL